MKDDLSLKKVERLRRKIDFRRIYSQGEPFRDGLFLLYVLKRPPNSSSLLRKVIPQRTPFPLSVIPACFKQESGFPLTDCGNDTEWTEYLPKKVGDAPGQTEGRGIGTGNRIGFVVSKRVAKKAVMRNRVRRLLREAYRQNKDKLKKGRDLVLVAREGAGELSFRETQDALLGLFGKAGLKA